MATTLIERSTYVAHALPGIVVALAFVTVSLRVVPAVYQTAGLLVDELGGAVAAVESGYMKQALVSSHAARRARIEAGEYNPTGDEIADTMIRRAIADSRRQRGQRGVLRDVSAAHRQGPEPRRPRRLWRRNGVGCLRHGRLRLSRLGGHNGFGRRIVRGGCRNVLALDGKKVALVIGTIDTKCQTIQPDS